MREELDSFSFCHVFYFSSRKEHKNMEMWSRVTSSEGSRSSCTHVTLWLCSYSTMPPSCHSNCCLKYGRLSTSWYRLVHLEKGEVAKENMIVLLFGLQLWVSTTRRLKSWLIQMTLLPPDSVAMCSGYSQWLEVDMCLLLRWQRVSILEAALCVFIGTKTCCN